MKPWKHKLLVAALPLAAITVGCLAAVEDVDDLVADDAEFRRAEPLRLDIRIADPGFSWQANDWQAEAAAAAHEEMAQQRAEARERNREQAAGSMPIDDLIYPALVQENVGVAFSTDAEGTADPCKISVPVGGAALSEHQVQLRSVDSLSIETIVMDRVESAEACEGAGFFFGAGESGELDSMQLCPESCDSVASAAAEGAEIAMEVVILE